MRKREKNVLRYQERCCVRVKRKIEIGDKVICGASGVIGIVEKFYYPTACKEQTMIVCDDGRRSHAPTDTFYKI